jgi:hypothetical protein
VPNNSPTLVPVPLAEVMVGEQGTLEDAPSPVAVAAVVFAPCVELLGVSPGNCTAACGLIDADALIPGAPPADADPIAAEPAAGANVGEVDVFDEAIPDEPPAQPSPIERLPMNEQAAPGRLVPAKLVPFTVVEPNAEEVVLDSVLVVDVPAPDVAPVWKAPCETV